MTASLHPRLSEFERQLAVSLLQPLRDELFLARGVEVWIKRDDLLHPIVSGNKWRKLKYILNDAMQHHARRVVSMGGAYSNHLHALAWLGNRLGLDTAAFVRGERPAQPNPTLTDLEAWGMQLTFVSRGDYRLLRQYKQPFALPNQSVGDYWLPEGGATQLALRGVTEIVKEIDIAYDVLLTACGTATTLAGLIGAAPAAVRLLGVSALKGGDFLQADVERMLGLSSAGRHNWAILQDFHCGGFAKTTPELLGFIDQFQARHGIALDPVYTGKLMLALYRLIENGYFASGSRIVALHTGGLQGAAARHR